MSIELPRERQRIIKYVKENVKYVKCCGVSTSLAGGAARSIWGDPRKRKGWPGLESWERSRQAGPGHICLPTEGSPT